jgi:hypothetical protein
MTTISLKCFLRSHPTPDLSMSFKALLCNTSIGTTLLLLLASVSHPTCAQAVETQVKHVKVYHETGRYGGWPANNGIWIWGNEILTGFSKAHYIDMGLKHNIDRNKTEIHVLARSKNGGESWEVEDPGIQGNLVPEALFGVQRTDVPFINPTTLKESMNFTHPDFTLTARMGKKDSSSFWYSYDKGLHWKGPFAWPHFGTSGMQARTDYIIDGAKEALMFLTVPKLDGKEGRVMCVETTDGGKSWHFKSWLGDEPDGYSIMPASVRISKNKLLVTTRDKKGDVSFISTYYSQDNGTSWTYQGQAVHDTGIGNPPAMIRMKDGRICLIYGFRSDPEGTKTSDIRAKISHDEGKTWSRDYVLRNDGSGRDIGYPRVVQRPDGKIVAIYYFMDKATGPERYIAASIWTPPLKK